VNARDLVQLKGWWLLPANLVDEIFELHIRANSLKFRSDGTRTHARYDDDRATLPNPVVARCDEEHMPVCPINVVASYERPSRCCVPSTRCSTQVPLIRLGCCTCALIGRGEPDGAGSFIGL
jgi:hypothetical protein